MNNFSLAKFIAHGVEGYAQSVEINTPPTESYNYNLVALPDKETHLSVVDYSFPTRITVEYSNSEWIREQSEIRDGNNVPEHLLGNQSGVFLGEINSESVIIPSGSKGNICILGDSGTGKSTCYGNQTLKHFDGGLLVVDVSGSSTEFYDALPDTPEKRPRKVLNLMEGLDKGFRCEPFHAIRQAPKIGNINLFGS